MAFSLSSTVTLSAKNRIVTVGGPRGKLTKSFRHLSCELTKVGRNKLRVDVWFAKRKQLACLQTICSHVNNLIKGVQYVCCITVIISNLIYYILSKLSKSSCTGSLAKFYQN